MAKQGMFTDEQVREIKMNLVEGVGLTALARRWGTSTETIGKMKRGLTYRHVVVPGEEGLRPEIVVVGPTQRAREVMSGKTDEELNDEGMALMQRLAKQQGVKKEALSEAEEMARAKVARYLGKE